MYPFFKCCKMLCCYLKSKNILGYTSHKRYFWDLLGLSALHEGGCSKNERVFLMPNYAGLHNLKHCLLCEHQRCHLPCWQGYVDESWWMVDLKCCLQSADLCHLHRYTVLQVSWLMTLCLLPGGSHHRSLAQKHPPGHPGNGTWCWECDISDKWPRAPLKPILSSRTPEVKTSKNIIARLKRFCQQLERRKIKEKQQIGNWSKDSQDCCEVCFAVFFDVLRLKS